jgi:hypothetical protein
VEGVNAPVQRTREFLEIVIQGLHPSDGELIRGEAATIASPQVPPVDVADAPKRPFFVFMSRRG